MAESDSNEGRSTSAKSKQNLPWVAFFWDIENCVVPPTKSAAEVARLFREKFVTGRRERDFIVVCDTMKGNPGSIVIEKLTMEHVTVVHIPSGAKNAADDKLKALIRKYADTHGPGDVVVLISGDVNFSTELQQVRYEHNLEVIVVHPENVHDSLVALAKEHYVYGDLIAQVPFINQYKHAAIPATGNQLDTMVFLSELPCHVPPVNMTAWMNQMASPQGGKVVCHNAAKGTASIVYKSMDGARRGRSHFDGNIAFNKLIVAKFSPASSLYAEQEAQAEGRPRALPLPTSNSSGNIVASNGGSPPNTLHPSASFPSKFVPTSVRAASATSRFDMTQNRARAPFSNENPASSGGLNMPIRLPNGVAVNGTVSSLPTAPASTSVAGATKLSFFKRNQIEKEAKAKEKAQTEADCAALVEKLKNASVNATTTDSGMKKPSSSYLRGDSVATSENRENVPPVLKKTETDGLAGNDSPPVKDNVKNQPVNVYFLNLDTEIDQTVLYCELLARVEKSMEVEHLSIYADSDTAAYAHVVVMGMENAKQLMASCNGFLWRGRPMEVTMENPGNRVIAKVPVAVQRAVVRLFFTVKKEEMPFVELLSLFRREYDQILDLKMLKLMPELVNVEEKLLGAEKKPTLMTSLTPVGFQYESQLVRQDCPDMLPLGYCEKHAAGGATNTMLIKKAYKPLGLYRVSLKEFSSRVIQLLARHNDSMPLSSFLVCYEEFFGKLVEDPDNGCYLEHILLSVDGVGVKVLPPNGPKILEKSSGTGLPNDVTFVEDSAIDVPELRKAVKDLLVRQPRSAMTLSEFPAGLHRQSGKLCDVRAYDQSRLIRLLGGLDSDVEVIGTGAERMVTLTHEAQLRRFAGVLERIKELCADGVEEVNVNNIDALYQVAFDRPFWLGNYGFCDFGDLMEGACKLTPPVPEVEIQKPKASADAIATGSGTKTKQKTIERLAQQTQQLLVATPDYREGFIQYPANYQKMFSKCLRNRDYGFDRLVDLLAAISHVVEVETKGADKFVRLQKIKRIEHFQRTLEGIIAGSEANQMTIAMFKEEFKKATGIDFKCENYDGRTDQDLFAQFGNLLELTGKKQRTLRFIKQNDHLIPVSQAAPPCTGTAVIADVKPSSSGGTLEPVRLMALLMKPTDDPLVQPVSDTCAVQGGRPVYQLSTRLAMSFR